MTKEEGLQKTQNALIFVGKPLEFDEVHFLSKLKDLEKAANEESIKIKELVSEIVPTYYIRPEDKKRDKENMRKLYSLGKENED